MIIDKTAENFLDEKLEQSPKVALVWQGVFWKIFSCGCFAVVNALVRFLSGGSPLDLSEPLPIYSIMLFQNLFGSQIALQTTARPAHLVVH